MAGNGDAANCIPASAIHIYAINQSMTDRFFFNADGELLIVPQLGALSLRTEMGILGVAPGEIAVIQRGIKFRVELHEQQARGYICENYGPLFVCPNSVPSAPTDRQIRAISRRLWPFTKTAPGDFRRSRNFRDTYGARRSTIRLWTSSPGTETMRLQIQSRPLQLHQYA